MVQEVHPDQGDLEFLELRVGLESLGNLQHDTKVRAAERTPESIRTAPDMPKAHEKRSCASPSILEGTPIQLRELLSIQSLPQRVSGTLRGGTPCAVSFYKNHKHITNINILRQHLEIIY